MEDVIPGLPEEMARECLIRTPYHRFRAARSVCKQWKQELESPLFHRLRKSSGLTRTLVALVQAQPSPDPSPSKHASTVPVYRLVLHEPETGAWAPLPPIPGCAHGLPLFCQVAAAGRELVVLGGWDPKTWVASDGVFIYDFVAGTWRRGARMPGPRRSFFACAAAPGRAVVLVAGGHDERKNALRSAMAYDVTKDEWVALPDMAKERDECKGVFRSGKFQVVGGYCTEMQGRFGKCSEAFDLVTRQWGPVEEETLGAATCPRTCVSVAAPDGKMYMCLAGGLVVMQNNTWHPLVQLPGDVRTALHVVAWNGNLVVMGSGSQGGTQVAYTLNLGPEKGLRWRRVELPQEYSGHVQAGCCIEI